MNDEENILRKEWDVCGNKIVDKWNSLFDSMTCTSTELENFFLKKR